MTKFFVARHIYVQSSTPSLQFALAIVRPLTKVLVTGLSLTTLLTLAQAWAVSLTSGGLPATAMVLALAQLAAFLLALIFTLRKVQMASALIISQMMPPSPVFCGPI